LTFRALTLTALVIASSIAPHPRWRLTVAVTLLTSAGVLAAGFALWDREPSWSELIWLASSIATLLVVASYSTPTGRRFDLAGRLLLGGYALAKSVLPLVAIATPLIVFADFDLPLWATAGGAAGRVAYVVLFCRARAAVRRRAGSRVPSAAAWIDALTQPLVIHNWIGGLSVLPFVAGWWLYNRSRRRAARRMHQRYGAVWARAVGRAAAVTPKP
jgi:hypothetical protein